MTAKSFAKSFAKERRAVARCRGRASDCVNTVNIALFLTDINFWGENETRHGVIQDFFLLTNCLPFYSSALVTPRVNLLGTLLALSLYRFACRDTRNVKAIFAFLSALSAFLLLGKPELVQVSSERYMAREESNAYPRFVSLHCQQIFSSVRLRAFHQLFGPVVILVSLSGA